jgi:hypothetical protein
MIAVPAEVAPSETGRRTAEMQRLSREAAVGRGVL